MLDDITVDFGYAVGDLKDAPEAKKKIKDLIISIIDDRMAETATQDERYHLEVLKGDVADL